MLLNKTLFAPTTNEGGGGLVRVLVAAEYTSSMWEQQ